VVWEESLEENRKEEFFKVVYDDENVECE